MRRTLAVLLATLAAVGLPALPAPAATAATAAPERTVPYTVTSRGPVAGDLDEFRAVARATLADPRGWSLGGTLAYAEVPSGGAFRLVLATGDVIAAASPACSREWSCRVGRDVYVNDRNWREATAAWPHGVAEYRRYVILHEVGHWLGLGHTSCPGPGRVATVMQQQSKSLQGCLANVWPVAEERDAAARAQGVSVARTAIEAKYTALGRAAGLLGAPVSWEHPLVAGTFQRFQRGSLYWSPTTGAHEVHGAIRERWGTTGWENGPLGYPTTDELPTPDGRGRYNHFAGSGGASVYWTPTTGAHEVYGAIRAAWAAQRFEVGPLGYPVTGEYDVPGGRRSDFAGGSVTWSRATGAVQVRLSR